MVDFDQEQASGPTIGDRLKEAREAKGLSLDDVARQTRIPIRHLQHIERGEWDALPAITYSVGFVRSYGNTVGLDGSELGAELRGNLGGTRTAAAAPAYYEPADPARVPPKALAIVALLLGILLVAGYLFWRNAAIDAPGAEIPLASDPAQQAQPKAAQPQPAAQPSASGPVVLTATGEVWLRVYEQGGKRIHEALMKPGERYEIPATATAPLINVGRPENLKVTVGATEIPPLGPPERPISGVSLKAADLVARLQGQSAAAPPAAAPAPAPAAQP